VMTTPTISHIPHEIISPEPRISVENGREDANTTYEVIGLGEEQKEGDEHEGEVEEVHQEIEGQKQVKPDAEEDAEPAGPRDDQQHGNR
jgi:hypothetical protein